MKKLIVFVLLAFSLQAHALELKGVKLPDTAQVGKAMLQLNGAGIRTKFFFKVYVGALYLDKKVHTAADVLADTGAKRVAMYWLRDVDSKRIRDGFEDDLKANNTPARLDAQVRQFLAIFDTFKEVKEGDVIDVDCVPDAGTIVSLNGKEIGRVAAAEFNDALLRVWFGDHPADEDLEEGMLGGD
jgi:Chalcone isomerase-like